MQELFDEIGLSEKLQQLGDLQREGSDIYMSTFSSIKHYPFFDEAFNCFMPFNPKNESIKPLFENDNDIFSLLMSNNMMCDSDKYSFCFSLMQLPDSQMDFMKHNLKTEIEQIKTDINDRSLKDSKLTFSLKANNYIQNLYRYYKLFKHTMSYNPFLFEKIYNSCLNIINQSNDKNIKKHDMIFYLRDDGHYVLHRVYDIKDGNYVLVGDNQTYLEYPIRPDQVIGKVEYIVKKGKRKDLKGFFYRFYLWIWHSLFIRKCCLKIYRSFRREK